MDTFHLTRKPFLIVSFVLLAFVGYTQELSPSDSLIFRALGDEMYQNMEHLQEEGFEKPFFMGYRVSDFHMKVSSASFGALINSKDFKRRNWNARIMVGDYQVSDENFNDSFEGFSNDFYGERIPIEEDYWGLRRLFWAGTNNVYKRAARLYKQKIKAIEDFDIDYSLPDFTEEKPSVHINTSKSKPVDLSDLERLSVRLSKKITAYDSIYNATVFTSDLSFRNYYLNSEGTKILSPGHLSMVFVNASKLDSEKKYNNTSLEYHASSFEELPSAEAIEKDIGWSIEHLKRKSTFEELEEDYNGPVLLKGQAVGEFFKAKLLSKNKGILPNRKAFNNRNEQAVSRYFEQQEEEMTDSTKRRVGNKNMVVKSLPHLQEFDGVQLIGSFQFDADGKVPEDELILIEDGLIKNKINGRIPAPQAERSTGHNRFAFSANGVGTAVAPGVIMVDFSGKMKKEEVLKLYEDEIEENDVDFGIVIEAPDLASRSKPRLYQKYSKKDSKPLKKASFSYSKKNLLKKIIAVSDEFYVYNFLHGGSGYGASGSGIPVSLIVPAAIVLKDIDVSKSTYRGSKLEAIVPKPTVQK